MKKLLCLGRLITTKMAPVVRKLFDTRSGRFFDASIDSLGVLPSMCDTLKKYGLFSYFDMEKYCNRKIREFEVNAWDIRLLLTTLICTLRKLALKKHLLASFGLFLNSFLIWSAAIFILRLE